MAEIKYVFEDDIFVAKPIERNYDFSFQIGNFIFDLDNKNEIKGIEIINASKLFGISKTVLKTRSIPPFC